MKSNIIELGELFHKNKFIHLILHWFKKNQRNLYWRRNRDLLIIFTGVYYILNIVDAHVFSHLNDFDIGNDISFNLSPKISKFGYSHNFGISLKFKF